MRKEGVFNMRDYKSMLKNVKYVLNNFDYLSSDEMYEFNSFVNYFVDKVIKNRFDNKFKKLTL